MFTPTFLPGLSLSLDYYNIMVNDVITSPTVQAIVNACYDLPDLNNPFCALFERVPAGGTGPRGEQAFRIVEGSLFQQPLNFAKLVAKGIDVSWRTAVSCGTLAGLILGSPTPTCSIGRTTWIRPTRAFKNVVVGKKGGELGDPEDSFNWNVALTRGVATFGYQMRYISSMYVNTYEDFNSVQGRPPENADWADIKKYPSRTYHDVRLGFDVTKDYNFYMGVDNADQHQTAAWSDRHWCWEQHLRCSRAASTTRDSPPSSNPRTTEIGGSDHSGPPFLRGRWANRWTAREPHIMQPT